MICQKNRRKYPEVQPIWKYLGAYIIPLSEADSQASNGSFEDEKSYKITWRKKCRLEFYLTILSKQAYLFIPKIVWSVIALNALYFLRLKGLKINS